MGALPILFAATQELPGGSYVGPDRLGERRGHRPGRPQRGGQRRRVGQEAWAASEQLTGVTSEPELVSRVARRSS